MDFTYVPKKYRPIPFWSWNEKLEEEQTRLQVRIMEQAGMGGFFMHARGGLQTEYMSEAWFENVTASVGEARLRGMRPWAYDENGWPSGFGNGAVNAMGVAYQQKYLRMEDSPIHQETAICKCGEHYFYYEINPFYVDTLDRGVVAKFIETAYQPYYEKYGTQIEGFFTDEPQVARGCIPWSFVFEAEYGARYNEDILQHLEELFLPVGDYERTRVKFWRMVTQLFSDGYMKQIYDWCEDRGLKLTGHLTDEDHLPTQIAACGACMPQYAYFHIPGMDWLGRNIWRNVTCHQLGSAAAQLGKKEVMAETFAMCGHNVSFAELKGIYEWQMVHGINLLCQHLQGYSMRGIRKRDYPPAMYHQQPWWDEYSNFTEAMSRVGMVLREGEPAPQVLLLHPQVTAWSMYSADDSMEIWDYNDRFYDVIDELEAKHILFHLGDELLMERLGRVEDGKLVIGNCRYSCVVDPGCKLHLESTEKLLEEFRKAGGKVVSARQLPENPVIDNPRITYTKRVGEAYIAHYFVNTSANREQAQVHVQGKRMDIYTGKLEPFGSAYTFEPWGSLLIIEDGNTGICEPEEPVTEVYPEKTMTVAPGSENCLTLDKCDYYFDGQLQEEKGYVLNIAERANALERPVQIHQDYYVHMAYLPEKLYLVCETPEKFRICVNGQELEQRVCGHFLDYTFPKLEIGKYLKLGENTISFDCTFVQSPQFYEDRKKAQVFESEKNKLAYDMEIEAVYLLGDFSVKTEGSWTDLERDAVRYQGGFVIDKPREQVQIKQIQKQGYPFFCGSLVLEGELNIRGQNPELVIDRKGVNALRVEIGGVEKTMLTENRLPLKPFGVTGKVKVRFTLVNNLRNLLGPHHLKAGEHFGVCPSHFFKEPCLWNKNPEQDWDEDYCFVDMGI